MGCAQRRLGQGRPNGNIQLKILIAGAGIGGLSAARALLDEGLEPLVLERASGPLTTGAGLTLWPDATEILERLGLLGQVLEHSGTLELGTVLDHRGTTLARVRLSLLARQTGYPTVGIARATLARLLTEALPPKVVRYGCEVVGFEERSSGVTARLSNGDTVQGAALIGADGIRSGVRTHLLGDSPRYSGYLGCQGITRHPISDRYSRWYHGIGGQFGLVPVGRGEAYWFATSPGPPETSREQLLARFAEWAHPIPEVLSELDPERAVVTPIYDSPVRRRWGRGRVTLLGDAAQATTPTLGHGACLAVSSAWELARCLRARPVEQALRTYEQRRWRPATFISLASRWIGELIHARHPGLCRLRNLGIRVLPDRLHELSAAWIVREAGGRG